MIGVEGDVVVDPVPLDVVLVAGRTVTDALESRLLGNRGVRPLRQVAQRRRHEVLRERLLLGTHSWRPGEVDRQLRVERHGRRRRARNRGDTVAVAVVVGALVGACAVGRGGLPGAVAFEGGERTALVGGDPHVNHRVVAAGVHGALRAVALGVGYAGDLWPVLPAAPAQVLVDVPLHQPAAVVDELGIVDRPLADDEHRRHERP